MCSDTSCWGIPAPHARTGGVLIVAQRRVKHTDTIFYVVRQNRLHPRERVIVLDIEIHGGGGLHLLLLQLLQWQQAAAIAALSFSLLTLTFSLTILSALSQPSQFALNKTCLFIGKYGQHGGASNALKCAINCDMNGAITNLVVGYCH